MSDYDDPFRCSPECVRMWQPSLVVAGIRKLTGESATRWHENKERLL